MIWGRWTLGAILIFLIILFGLSFPLVDKGNIFSNIFVDSYSPRKVLIIERNPIRIVYMGEFLDTALNETVESELSADENSTKIKPRTVNALVGVIRELRLMNSHPVYPLNEKTIIDVDSRLTGDRNRGASKSVVLQSSTGEVTEIQTSGEAEQ